jgi:hypothetical protein
VPSVRRQQDRIAAEHAVLLLIEVNREFHLRRAPNHARASGGPANFQTFCPRRSLAIRPSIAFRPR